MGKVLPILALLLGSAAGYGGATYLGLGPEVCESEDCPTDVVKAEPETLEYFELNDQFIVPIVKADQVQALVVLSLSIETVEDARDRVFQREPKLRDAFLRVLFDHAYTGAFDGRFTDGTRLELLRSALTLVAQDIVGDDVSGVLITDIIRQDR